ncbi:hypothetical protein C8Q76DRAFT_701631 [Earliella scabrosa]|nr:hypothetical protein C8Q76DRAFT_701631 [Earliella scabrosa]
MQAGSSWSLWQWTPTGSDRARKAVSQSYTQDLRLPLEIWTTVFSILGDPASPTAVRDTLACVFLSRALRPQAEPALYRHVSISTHVTSLSSFLTGVCGVQRRALAVRTLRLRPPRPLSVLETLSSRLAGLAFGKQSGDPLTLETRSRMNAMMLRALDGMANLTDLEFPIHNEYGICLVQLRDMRWLGAPDIHERPPRSMQRPESSSDLGASQRAVSFSIRAHAHYKDSQWRSHLVGTLHYLAHHNITHLTLVERAIEWDVSPLRSLAAWHPRLVSLRLVLARPKFLIGHDMWPTDVMAYNAFPELRHLEVSELKSGYCESPFTPFDGVGGYVHYEHHLSRAQTPPTCPKLTFIVWFPAEYHRALAVHPTDSRYREELPQYTARLFELYPLLERVERRRIEDLFEQGRAEYVAFTREREGGPVVACPCEYNRERWLRT